ncbi:hypothetical protein DBR06_SOUSAS4410080, partial [Sousa chinensis]
MAAKKTRQSSDKQNGPVAKVKGHRTQKHKERIRLLRQKREAAVRKKYNLLQDSSTSDSDLTCDSSTSSSDDAAEVSGITAEIPGRLDPRFLASDRTSAGNAPLNEEINIASSHSEVEIVRVQRHARWVHPQGGVPQSVSSWKHGSGMQYVSTRQTQSWTAVTPQQTWASPAEVVDLTLDEDSRRKYLLLSIAMFSQLTIWPQSQIHSLTVEENTFVWASFGNRGY